MGLAGALSSALGNVRRARGSCRRRRGRRPTGSRPASAAASARRRSCRGARRRRSRRSAAAFLRWPGRRRPRGGRSPPGRSASGSAPGRRSGPRRRAPSGPRSPAVAGPHDDALVGDPEPHPARELVLGEERAQRLGHGIRVGDLAVVEGLGRQAARSRWLPAARCRSACTSAAAMLPASISRPTRRARLLRSQQQASVRVAEEVALNPFESGSPSPIVRPITQPTGPGRGSSAASGSAGGRRSCSSSGSRCRRWVPTAPRNFCAIAPLTFSVPSCRRSRSGRR